MKEKIQMLRKTFESGVTLQENFRRGQLEALRAALKSRETQVLEALREDLGKADFEGYATELGMVYEEIAMALKNLSRWMRDKRASSPLSQFPASSRVHREPYGLCLIMAPWNYPLQLTFSPLVGALAAGNTALIKPSNYAPATARVMAGIVEDMASPAVACVLGGRQENQALLEEQFDFIFFTGSVQVGKLVMTAAARNLTPVVLELGGKSPCILAPDADFQLAVRRIVWGKLLNCGQTCVAPDYVLCPRDRVESLVQALQRAVTAQFGEEPLHHPDYPKIVNQRHFLRLSGLIDGEKVRWGGERDPERLRIGPTLIEGDWESPSMQEEIFGPLLPILAYDTLEEALNAVRRRPRPLALYCFTQSRALARRVMTTVSFGGGCVNDTVVHLTNPRLPFGGVGASGMGSYHGPYSFACFSHDKAIMTRGTHPDIPLRYPPYSEKAARLVRRLMK
jgi:aldehyde dehydrogenase (NAD+)